MEKGRRDSISTIGEPEISPTAHNRQKVDVRYDDARENIKWVVQPNRVGACKLSGPNESMAEEEEEDR